MQRLLLLVAVLIFSLPTSAYPDTPVLPEGQIFVCTPTHVWDGDGPIWCKEGARIRLAGIATRELNGRCLKGHPCPSANAIDARNALVRLVGTAKGIGRHGHILVNGPAMRCLSNGSAGGNRTGAWCVSPKGGDVNCAMVRGGWALKWEQHWGKHSCKIK
jgi:endonuclease YncB( thermonuclease family)